MISLHKLGQLATIMILVAHTAALSAKADPLLFSNVVALQNGGTTSVDVFSNTGTTLLGPQISFLVDITGLLPPGVTNTLLVSYSEAGGVPIVQSFDIPLFETVQPPFTLLFSITSPGASFTGIPATLTLDILGSSPDFVIPSGPGAGQRVNSFTYSFIVTKPVPEPTALILLGTGLVGFV